MPDHASGWSARISWNSPFRLATARIFFVIRIE